MANEKQNMDNFLRDSLGNLEMNPSKNVWKGVSKKLILLELIRLNFSNIGKSWLYSGVAAVTTFAGFTLYQLNQEPSPTETPHQTEVISASETTEDKNDQQDTYQITKEELESVTDGEIITELDPIKEISDSKDVTKASILPKKNKDHKTVIEPNPVIDSSNTDLEEGMTKENKTPELNQDDDNQDEVISMIEQNDQQKTNTPQTQKTQTIQQTELQNNSKEKELNHKNQINKTEEAKNDDSPKKDKIIAPIIISEEDEKKKSKSQKPVQLNWFVGANYTPEWPISSNEMYVNNHQLGFKAGVEYKKWAMSIGIGMKTEKTPSQFMAHYSTYDSVGFFYDIEYYEQVPSYPDSIIIHYTLRNIYDSIDHEAEVEGPDQKRRWIFIPIDFSYQLYKKPKYELMAKVSANFGWTSYTEEIDVSTALAGYYQLENTTTKNNDTYLQVGLGVENNFSIMPNWWIYAEPRLNYYVKSPYEIKGNSSNGPFAFGLQVGIKYKFNR